MLVVLMTNFFANVSRLSIFNPFHYVCTKVCDLTFLIDPYMHLSCFIDVPQKDSVLSHNLQFSPQKDIFMYDHSKSIIIGMKCILFVVIYGGNMSCAKTKSCSMRLTIDKVES